MQSKEYFVKLDSAQLAGCLGVLEGALASEWSAGDRSRYASVLLHRSLVFVRMGIYDNAEKELCQLLELFGWEGLCGVRSFLRLTELYAQGFHWLPCPPTPVLFETPAAVLTTAVLLQAEVRRSTSHSLEAIDLLSAYATFCKTFPTIPWSKLCPNVSQTVVLHWAAAVPLPTVAAICEIRASHITLAATDSIATALEYLAQRNEPRPAIGIAGMGPIVASPIGSGPIGSGPMGGGPMGGPLGGLGSSSMKPIGSLGSGSMGGFIGNLGSSSIRGSGPIGGSAPLPGSLLMLLKYFADLGDREQCLKLHRQLEVNFPRAAKVSKAVVEQAASSPQGHLQCGKAAEALTEGSELSLGARTLIIVTQKCNGVVSLCTNSLDLPGAVELSWRGVSDVLNAGISKESPKQQLPNITVLDSTTRKLAVLVPTLIRNTRLLNKLLPARTSKDTLLRQLITEAGYGDKEVILNAFAYF
ncbi:hypothetical protein GNI_135520 [Gregarina niphandrodes]|uniref:Uncharacterized protein n=1 Tax=Gregarina niphandrodes TaxID=110365 RepID=A0A023B0V5_GRENI|nr:hypothetical protein GNI_135520 [Gregarina niphandrodes]EZG46052.1 hypothetical protein GNI_135520 [Gregarina niphandrodes]|eukprot:XP_011132383.1 hypothetical protein GNI_135520 [Gregarina niphandrodes]